MKTVRQVSEFNKELSLKGFKVFKIEDDDYATKIYNRKDFYKICLTTGKSNIHYSNRSFTAEGTVLFFGNPHIPYSWETLSRDYSGYTCLFSEEFLKPTERLEGILQSPLFKLGGTPVLEITMSDKNMLDAIFEKMILEQDSDYVYKDELIRNYIQLILHESMKLQPKEQIEKYSDAKTRLASVFFELLERQFPVAVINEPLQIRTPQQFADQLNVHVNYLNKALKEVTGKTTSMHIAERTITEAKALLQHTNWNVGEIAFALGYEYTTYFNNFFKKYTGNAPSDFRVENYSRN